MSKEVFFLLRSISGNTHSTLIVVYSLYHHRLLCISFIGLLIHFSRLILISLIYFCKVGALRRSSCANGHSHSCNLLVSKVSTTSHRHKTKNWKIFHKFLIGTFIFWFPHSSSTGSWLSSSWDILMSYVGISNLMRTKKIKIARKTFSIIFVSLLIISVLVWLWLAIPDDKCFMILVVLQFWNYFMLIHVRENFVLCLS